jgi:hypothetical protein
MPTCQRCGHIEHFDSVAGKYPYGKGALFPADVAIKYGWVRFDYSLWLCPKHAAYLSGSSSRQEHAETVTQARSSGKSTR